MECGVTTKQLSQSHLDHHLAIVVMPRRQNIYHQTSPLTLFLTLLIEEREHNKACIIEYIENEDWSIDSMI